MAIVEIEHFSFAYPQAKQQDSVDSSLGSRDVTYVINDVSCQVNKGDFCVLVGSTGSGKTTLLRSLKPELAPAGFRKGTVRACGTALVEQGRLTHALSEQESAARIGYVMQDPEAQIVCDTVWHELAFGLENLGYPQDVMHRRVAEVAHFFGIEPWVRQCTDTLSGGQKQLVNLAAILALRPDILLLDEPTAQLDPHAVKQFLFMLSRVNRELGVTILMATHAPEEVELYTNHVIRLSEDIPCASCASALKQAQARLAARLGLIQKANPLITVSDVSFRYKRDEPWVLRNLSLSIKEGSVHALVGGNGCGKSTLLKVMASTLKAQRGTVKKTTHSQALLPQDPKMLFVCDTVEEEIAEWRIRCGYTHEDELDILEKFNLLGCLHQHPYDLSGGQQQKLALAKLLLCKVRILFLDEPTKGLDPQSCADVSHCIRRMADEGVTVVFVTHDLDFTLVTADTVSMIFDGEIACSEPVDLFFTNNIVYRPHHESRLFGVI